MSFPSAWSMGGLIGPEIETGAIRAVLAELRERLVIGMRIRPNPIHGEFWRNAATRAETLVAGRSHVVRLGCDAEEAWAQLSRSARRGIKIAEQAGVEVACDDTGQMMTVLYDLTAKATVRWAAQHNEPLASARWGHRRRDPLSRLEAVAQRLGPACKLWIAWKDGEPIGANLVLQGRNAHANRGALDPERGRQTRAGYLLEWHAIRDAAEAGCDWCHLGETGGSESLAAYKERFGAHAYDYDHIHVERLPITSMDRAVRGAVKRAIGFRDQRTSPQSNNGL